MFILTNSEEFVKDVFELFSKFNHPGLHGADHGRMKLLLCQGLAPTAYSVYYCVKRLSRIFFKSLTQAAGRRSPRHHRCRCRGRPKGGPLWESREMLCSEIAVHRSRIIACGDIFVVHRSSFIHMLALYVKKNHLLAKYCQASITSRKTPSNPAFII